MPDTTFASNPGQLQLSDKKLRKIRPDLFGIKGYFRNKKMKAKLNRTERELIAEHLQKGDTRAAIIISTNPLLVAAYTDEIDCIAMLKFSQQLAMPFFKKGMRLLTVNSYNELPSEDLIPGPEARGYYSGFHPMIADFLVSDRNAIAAKQTTIPEIEWVRTERLALQYHQKHSNVYRDGRPIFSASPLFEL